MMEGEAKQQKDRIKNNRREGEDLEEMQLFMKTVHRVSGKEKVWGVGAQGCY